jgi:uncharacterized membrane protein
MYKYKMPLNKASRLLWAAIGTVLVAVGTRRRSLWDAGCSAAGSGMLLWAFAAPPVPEEYVRDIVDISSEDSFPASDPPSSW